MAAASLSVQRARRFSARLSRPWGKNRASGIVLGAAATSPASPTTSKRSHTSRQKASGSVSDHACRSGVPDIGWLVRSRAAATSRAIAVPDACSGSGTQVGLGAGVTFPSWIYWVTSA